jgi:hypothetical protein
MCGSSCYWPISTRSYLEASKMYGKNVYCNIQVAFHSSVRLLGHLALWGVTLEGIITDTCLKVIVKMSGIIWNERDSKDFSENSERQIVRNSVSGSRTLPCARSTEPVIFVNTHQGSEPFKMSATSCLKSWNISQWKWKFIAVLKQVDLQWRIN